MTKFRNSSRKSFVVLPVIPKDKDKTFSVSTAKTQRIWGQRNELTWDKTALAWKGKKQSDTSQHIWYQQKVREKQKQKQNLYRIWLLCNVNNSTDLWSFGGCD